MNWETISKSKDRSGDFVFLVTVERARVFNGWIVRNSSSVVVYQKIGAFASAVEMQSSITFVPDKNQEWRI